jgi:hypothetical protein
MRYEQFEMSTFREFKFNEGMVYGSECLEYSMTNAVRD